MMNKNKKLFAIAAFAIASTAFQSGVASAQTSGVGGDGYTRILWRGAESSISMWKVDSNLDFYSYHTYGPYNGWTPIALTTATVNSYSYVLWRHTSGLTSLWEVDPNLNFVNYHAYGPFDGWR